MSNSPKKYGFMKIIPVKIGTNKVQIYLNYSATAIFNIVYIIYSIIMKMLSIEIRGSCDKEFKDICVVNSEIGF